MEPDGGTTNIRNVNSKQLNALAGSGAPLRGAVQQLARIQHGRGRGRLVRDARAIRWATCNRERQNSPLYSLWARGGRMGPAGPAGRGGPAGPGRPQFCITTSLVSGPDVIFTIQVDGNSGPIHR